MIRLFQKEKSEEKILAVIDLLDAVRIPSARSRFDEYPFQFSGGMMQRAMIVDALSRSGGSLGPTAQALRVPKSTLYDKMTRLGLVDGDREAP